jgi:hypothetical protein
MSTHVPPQDMSTAALPQFALHTKCGALCVNTQTDANDCGACDKRCATGQTCTAGLCG